MCVLERVVSRLGIVLGVEFEKSEAARASVEAFRNADGFELTVRAIRNKRMSDMDDKEGRLSEGRKIQT